MPLTLIDAKPKGKAKDKQANAQAAPAKATSAPSSPVKSEGPMPPKTAAPEVTNKAESRGKGKSKGANSGSDKPSIDKKGQRCIRFSWNLHARRPMSIWPYPT